MRNTMAMFCSRSGALPRFVEDERKTSRRSWRRTLVKDGFRIGSTRICGIRIRA